MFSISRHIPAALILALTLALPVSAQVTQTLQSPPGPVTAGSTVTIILLVTNNGISPASVSAAAVLPLVAATPFGARGFTLTRGEDEPSTLSVPAGGFARVHYVAPVPAEARGFAVLDAEDQAYGRIAVEVQAAPEPSTSVASGLAPRSAPDVAVAPVGLARRRSLGVLPYEPVYFSMGFNDRLNARFQLSLKLRPFGPADESIDLPGSILGNLYGGFTQTSLWDLESNSKPFFDTSYKPTVLYQRYSTGGGAFGAKFGYAAGFEHESNGQGGTASRSMNLLVFRPTLRWELRDGWAAVFSPKLYVYVEKSENADLPKYRGYGDYLLYVEHPESWKLAATIRVGTSGHGSVLLDGAYPLRELVGGHTPTGWMQGFLHIQYFNGYTESLRTYNVRTPWQLRLGYMLIR